MLELILMSRCREPGDAGIRSRRRALQGRFRRQIKFRPIIDGLPANQDIGNAVGIANLKDFRELFKGETVAHRSGPFCHRCRHLAQVGDLPFRPVTDQRDLTLIRQEGTRTALLHSEAALSGFLCFDFAESQGFYDGKTLGHFHR